VNKEMATLAILCFYSVIYRNKMIMTDVYVMYTLRMVVTAIVLFSALHYGALFFDYNLAEYFNLVYFRVFNKRAAIHKIVYAVFAICGLILAIDRTTWLPFLGDTVLPSAVVPLKTNVGDTSVEVNVTPGAKVVYWAAKPVKEIETSSSSSLQDEYELKRRVPLVEQAYDDFSNNGVVLANDLGVATLSFDKGSEYVVPSGKQLKSHVHYRECGISGWMGQIETVFLPAPPVTERDLQEGFDNALLAEVGGLNEGFVGTNAMMVELAGAF
jgi:hypothetical protein